MSFHFTSGDKFLGKLTLTPFFRPHFSTVWLSQVKSHHLKYRAYGALKHLRRYAEKLGQQWIRGSASKALSVA